MKLEPEEIRAIARAVADELRAGSDPDHVDQHASPLGARRHVSAIRSGKLPGFRIGRRWLARRADLATYMAAFTSSTATKSKPRERSAAELREAELGLMQHDS